MEGKGEGEGESRALCPLRSSAPNEQGTYIVTHSSSLSAHLYQRGFDTLDTPCRPERYLGKRNNEACRRARRECVCILKNGGV